MRFIIAIIFIWAGFILSISFFESWIKFRAAGVTVPVALSIGKLVFTVLNRIEWVFVLLMAVSFFSLKISFAPVTLYLLAVVVVALLLQTFWMLPELNERVTNHIKGIKLSSSYLHHFFVLTEFVKLICLLGIGSGLLQTI